MLRLQLTRFVVEAGGRFEPETLEWLQEVHRKAFPKDEGGAYSYNLRRCLERIQVGLMSSVARSVIKLGVLARTWQPLGGAGAGAGAMPAAMMPPDGDVYEEEAAEPALVEALAGHVA